jgi:hypothetical protein
MDLPSIKPPMEARRGLSLPGLDSGQRDELEEEVAEP